MGKRNSDGIFMSARREFEALLVEAAVKTQGGNKMATAKYLGISYATLKTICRDAKETKAATDGFSKEEKALTDAIKATLFARLEGRDEGDVLDKALVLYREKVKNEIITKIAGSVAGGA